MDSQLPPDGFEDGHTGNELPPDGFEDANHPGNAFVAALTGLLPSKEQLLPRPISPAEGARGAFSQVMQAFTNPLRVPATASQNSANLGGMVAEGLGQHFPGLPAQIPATAGLATQVLTDPSTYAGAANGTGEVATGALDSAAQTGLNKLLAPLGQVLSATKQGAIKALFNDPIGTLSAMSSKDAGNALGEIYKGLGITEDEMRLIAKAADRGTGGSQTVYDQILKKLKDAQLPAVDPKSITEPSAVFIGNQEFPGSKSIGLYNVVGNTPDRGRTLGYEDIQKLGLAIVGKDATRDTANSLPIELSPTMGELIAGRRAASKLSTIRSGMEKAQTVKDLNTFQNAMSQIDPEETTNVLSALHDVAKGKTKEAFLNLLPLNKNLSANALRGMLAVGSAMAGHPGMMALESPLTTGLGTLAASAGYNAAKVGLSNPLVRGLSLQQLMEYAQKQQAQ